MGFRLLRVVSAVLLGLSVGASVVAATPDHWFDKPLSPRIVSYRIQAKLNWEEKGLSARETLTWRNPGWIETGREPTGELGTRIPEVIDFYPKNI